MAGILALSEWTGGIEAGREALKHSIEMSVDDLRLEESNQYASIGANRKPRRLSIPIGIESKSYFHRMIHISIKSYLLSNLAGWL